MCCWQGQRLPWNASVKEREWPRESGGKLAKADFVMITSQLLYHLGLFLLFSYPLVKKGLFTKHFKCKIRITWFSIILLDILVTDSLSGWWPCDNHYYYRILLMTTKLKKIDIFINRCTSIQGWMNGFLFLRHFGKGKITYFCEESLKIWQIQTENCWSK